MPIAVRCARVLVPVAAALALVSACGSSGSSKAADIPDTKAKPPAAPESQPLEGRPKSGAKVGQHWHAAFGVDYCGQWLPNAPFFEAETGIHSHGDGLIHIHPFVESAAGPNATVGTFLHGAQWTATATSFNLGGDRTIKNGDRCPDGKAGVVRWAVNGHEQHGDISAFIPFDGDVITLAFLPEGQPIPKPPQEKALEEITDLG